MNEEKVCVTLGCERPIKYQSTLTGKYYCEDCLENELRESKVLKREYFKRIDTNTI